MAAGGSAAPPAATPGPPPPAPAPKLPVRPQNLQACTRNVHQWGPPDGNGWARCVSCGYVSITGGSAGQSGAYDLGDEMARSVVQLG